MKYTSKPTIGLRDVCYAILTESDDGTFDYGAVKQVAGAIDATLSPNANVTKLYADDGVFDSYSSLGDIQLSLQMADLPPEVQADWLGFALDANGVLVKHQDAQGKAFAIGWRAKKSNGKFRYVWAFKCKANMPEEAAHTEESGSVTFSTRTITLDLSARNDGNWQVVVDEDRDGVSAEVVKTFLDAVYVIAPAA